MKRIMLRVSLLMMLLAVANATTRAEQKSSAQSAELHFLVLKQETGKPIRNASVVLHRLDKEGRQKDTLELKTDNEGRASLDGIGYGRVRVQVIVHGLQTFGEDYDVVQPRMDFKIELKPPKQQFSIYK